MFVYQVIKKILHYWASVILSWSSIHVKDGPFHMKEYLKWIMRIWYAQWIFYKITS